MSTGLWVSLWTWIYALGLGSFFALALAMIPLGARDVWRLMRSVQADEERRR